jgi:hypothetical protein
MPSAACQKTEENLKKWLYLSLSSTTIKDFPP